MTAADAGGGPHVRVFDGTTGAVMTEGLAYEVDFHGGVRVAVCDVNGDGHADIAMAPGPGRPPLVRIADGATRTLLREFLAYPESVTEGLFPACGDVTGDGVPDLVVAAGAGVTPAVRLFDGVTGALVESSAWSRSPAPRWSPR